ncbi:L,D-transpeptidase family protein [Facklamia sp. 7083-14-GEN3]|uniref:L,D-transpeptidase family protein n=1 Tax=Facklamia sp. 7083-14-GEN3 TaxID=2973478 RepID=UPI00215D09DE|nr:L,D-transpeptidase family protein [Facklamia sp. 7083-14-GEN3]MCR8968417.1 L,D-transpeptidase/peptidoglycan binding protein [Facklamia sp. 7083-14-GEN3]
MKTIKRLFISVVVLSLIFGLIYAGGIGYYSDKFQANTKIGQIDVSNLTLPQAEEKIEQYVLSQQIDFLENDQAVTSIKMGDLNPQFNQQAKLEEVYQHQNPNRWLNSYFKGENYEDTSLIDLEIDYQALEEKLMEQGLDNSDRSPSKDAFIDYNEAEGYHVVQEQQGTQIDNEALKDGIMSQIQSGKSAVEINDFYAKPTLTSEDEKIKDFQSQIDEIVNTKITLTIDGNEEVIPAKEIEKWIHFDNENQVVFDENMIMEFLKGYNDKYSSYLNPRTFNSTLQGQVTVQPGTLGWSIDRQAETAQIIADLKKGEDVKRDPAIAGTGYGSEGNDIGSTYVEVDLANQTMFVYVEGQLLAQTPIVSGKDGAETIPGAYAIWGKERDRYLTGYDWVKEADYKVHVEYWMPFDTVGQGIHDTAGRSAYGGNIYRNAGSLGCINTPMAVMQQIYNTIEIGTPVIVF